MAEDKGPPPKWRNTSSLVHSPHKARPLTLENRRTQCLALYDFPNYRTWDFHRGQQDVFCEGVLGADHGFEHVAIGGDELRDVCGRGRGLEAGMGSVSARSARFLDLAGVSTLCHMSAVESACGVSPAENAFYPRPYPAPDPIRCYCRAKQMCASGLAAYHH